jgi:hypothetical protein
MISKQTVNDTSVKLIKSAAPSFEEASFDASSYDEVMNISTYSMLNLTDTLVNAAASVAHSHYIGSTNSALELQATSAAAQRPKSFRVMPLGHFGDSDSWDAHSSVFFSDSVDDSNAALPDESCAAARQARSSKVTKVNCISPCKAETVVTNISILDLPI